MDKAPDQGGSVASMVWRRSRFADWEKLGSTSRIRGLEQSAVVATRGEGQIGTDSIASEPPAREKRVERKEKKPMM